MPHAQPLPEVVRLNNLIRDDASSTAAAANTRTINAAISAYSGTNARLELPAGTFYVEQANPGGAAATRAWSIRFGPGVSDLSLVGQGTQVTKIVQAGVGNSGQWDAIVVDGAQRITMSGFRVEQGTIDNPKLGDQMALIGVYATQDVDTSDVTISDVYFGPCIGDAFRVLGDGTSGETVQRVRLLNFTMRTNGHPYGSGGYGLGSRSGVSIQRGCRDLEIGNGFIYGAKNSPFEMEPTGANIVTNFNVHDLIIDNEGGQTYLALTLAGSENAQLKRVVLDNVIVLQGGMAIAWTFDLTLHGVIIYSSGLGPMAGNAQALAQMLNTNEDTTISDVKIIRDTGSTAGPLLTVSHGVGASNTTKRLHIHGGEWRGAVGAGTGLAYVDVLGGDAVSIDGLALKLPASAATEYAIKFRPNTDDMDQPVIDGVEVVAGDTKLAAAVWFVATNSLSIANISVSRLRAKNAATHGALFDVNGGTSIDAHPIIQGCDFTGCTNPWTAQNSAAGAVFPVVGGNKAGVAIFEGDGAPSHDAPLGSLYLRRDGGASTTLYVCTAASTWTAK